MSASYRASLFAALSLIACSAVRPPIAASLPDVTIENGRLCMSEDSARAMIQADIDREAACKRRIEESGKLLRLEQASHADTRRQLQRTLWWNEWGPVLMIGGLVVGFGVGGVSGFALGRR